MFKPLVSKVLVKAHRRLAGVKYLNPDLNFGNGISVQEFSLKTEAMQAKLDAHNAMVTEFTTRMSESREEIRQLEDSLSKTVERMLNTVAVLYGKNSSEYELVADSKPTPAVKKTSTTPTSTSSTDQNDGVLKNLPEMVIENSGKNSVVNAKKNGNGNGKVAIE
jgi:hypothetical protein